MMNADHRQVARAAMAMVDGLQDFPVEVQSLAAAVIFQNLCDEHEIKPNDAMTAAENLRRHAAERSAELRAVGEYIKHELGR